MKKLFLAACIGLMGCQPAAEKTPAAAAGLDAATPQQVDAYLAQYTPYPMHFDASALPAKDKLILQKLVQAAQLLHEAYWQQTSVYGRQLQGKLEAENVNPYATKLLTLLKRNGGPFEKLNNNEPFIGDKRYYPGEEFYPEGMTAAQFDAYVHKLPETERREFMSPYTVIRPDGEGGYQAVRFYEAYKKWLDPVIALLNDDR